MTYDFPKLPKGHKWLVWTYEHKGVAHVRVSINRGFWFNPVFAEDEALPQYGLPEEDFGNQVRRVARAVYWKFGDSMRAGEAAANASGWALAAQAELNGSGV